MAWRRWLLLVLMLSLLASVQPGVRAEGPPTDEEFLHLVSQAQNIPLDRLRIGDRVDLTYPLTGVLLYTAKVYDTETGRGYLAALDRQHNPADVQTAAAAEEKARTETYGKLDPRLFGKKAKIGPSERIPVMLWLNVPELVLDRTKSLDDHLAAQERLLGIIKKRVLDVLATMKVQGKAAKYGPVIFAQLTSGQIDEIAKLSEVALIFGAEAYKPSSDHAGTTARAYQVWTAGNTGSGTVKPVVLDPGGVSDGNPYLNNATHAVHYWCAAITTSCPNGKNIGDHATNLAGIIASTHALYRGIAPSVQAIISANTQSFNEDAVVEAFEWARGNGGDPTVVSWNTDCGGFQTFLSRYLDWATRNLFATAVVAAGNHPTFCLDATNDEKVGAPGVAWSVITVGSVNDNNTAFWSGDSMSTFSDWRNPDFAPGMEKPEVVAVGQDIRTTDTLIDDWLTASGVNGTSYAAGQVAGQLSLMLSRQPGQNIWPETNKAAVLASAYQDIESGPDRDGVGAVVMNHSDDTYRLKRFINDSSAGSPLQAGDFPRQHLDALTLEAGQRVRVAIAWDSVANPSSSDVLGADIDLCVRHPNNATIVACSVSYQNAWEVVEFTAPVAGQYDILVDLASADSGWPGTFLGIAWSTQSLPNFCTGAIEVPSTGGTYSVDTKDRPTFFDAYQGWSRDQSGREQVLKLTLDAPQDIRFSDTNPELDLHILQFASCSSDPITPTVVGSGTDLVSITNAPAGTYYLVVDGADGAVGTTTVTVSNTPPPAAPADLVATAGDAQVSLSWTAASGADSYTVKRSTTSGGGYTAITEGVTDTSYIDTSVSNGTTYYYVVSAVNGGGESANSNEAAATPTAPSGSPIKAMTFESGSLTGADGADSINGSVTLEEAAPIKEVYSARIAGAGKSYLEEDFAGVDEFYTSFYLKLYTLPSENVRIVRVTNAGTLVGNIMLRRTNALQLRVGSAVIGDDSANLEVGKIYRVGLVQKKGTGSDAVLEAYLAEGDAPFGAPFASTTTGSWTSQATQVRIGATNANVLDAALDDIKLDAALMP